MANAGFGAFLGGLAGGIVTGQGLALREKAEARAEAAEKRAEETHKLSKRIKEIGLGRMEREEPLHEKEVQVKGLELDLKVGQLALDKELQPFMNDTRRIFEQVRRLETEGRLVEAQALKDRLPQEIAARKSELGLKLGELAQREGAVIWNLFKQDKGRGINAFNNSQLIDPGMKAHDAEIVNAEAMGPDGKRVNVQTLALKDKDGKVIKTYPINQLEALSQSYGAQYKTVGKSLVRINGDGSITPLYDGDDDVVVVPEGASVVRRRGGKPVAAGGVSGGGAPPGSGKLTARVDARVKQSTQVVNRYFGISEFTGLDAKNQPKYSKIVALAGEKVRAGADPEAAAKAAIEEVELAEKTATPRAGGATGYTGPTPWRR